MEQITSIPITFIKAMALLSSIDVSGILPSPAIPHPNQLPRNAPFTPLCPQTIVSNHSQKGYGKV